MISLEQIKTLDEKVKQAVSVIADLRGENTKLKQKLSDYQSRIEELERLIDDFKRDQGAIEQGILDAIDQLNKLEHAPSPPNASAGDTDKTGSGADSQAAETAAAGPAAAADGTETAASEAENGGSAVEKPGIYSEEEPEDQEDNELDIF